MGRGLLVAAFDFSTAHTDEFHDWYDLEHIPERQAVPGFGACERWIAPGDAAAPEGARALLLNAMNVAPEAEDDFNAWYDEEHLVALARVPGTLAARRYRSTEAGGGTHRYVAIYHLASPDVARSAAWKAAADTPWSARVRPHFRDRIRILTRRYVRGG
jgi:heme-degrading monooxygenase HmoA